MSIYNKLHYLCEKIFTGKISSKIPDKDLQVRLQEVTEKWKSDDTTRRVFMIIPMVLNIDDQTSKIEHAQQESLGLQTSKEGLQTHLILKNNQIQHLPEKDLDVKVFEATQKLLENPQNPITDKLSMLIRQVEQKIQTIRV